jgi:hypothetical protein
MGKNIFGTDDDDGLDGTNGADTIIGYAGDDVISGGNGDDVLIGDGLLSGTRIRLVSTDSNGIIGGAASFNASFAPNGTQVVFESDAVNFAGADGMRSIYAKNLVTGALTLISAAQDGTAADANSSNAHFSADGKSVVFTSLAGNLTGGSDTNAGSDIFVKDLITGVVSVVSTMKNGSQATGDSDFATLSSDGTKVLFQSTAEDLVGNDSNGYVDIFVKNLKTGTVRLLSADADGVEGNGGSDHAVFSANGKLIAFESTASSFVSGDNNGVADVFVKDLVSDDIIRVSSAKDGTVGNASSSSVSFGPDGNKAIFTSFASNLVGTDSNGVSDVFIKNLVTGGVRLVSTNADGDLGNGASFGGVFSPDGTRVAFFSNATNLVDGDNNGVTDAFVKDLVSGDVYRISLANSGLEGNFASTVINWSPDGTQLVFQSQASNLTNDTDTNNAYDVFVATIDLPQDGDDQLDGGLGNDTFVPGGGLDFITGGAGDDIAYFHGQLDHDGFDGGDGFDTLVLEGDYIEQVSFDNGIANVELVQLKGHHTYNFEALDEDVPATGLTVDGTEDDAAHSIVFDASDAIVGFLTFKDGAGNDVVSGGLLTDSFYMLKGGNDTVHGNGGADFISLDDKLTASDKIDGGAGNDVVQLDGTYSNLVFNSTTMVGVEEIDLAPGHSYKLTTAQTTVAAGAQLIVDSHAFGGEDTLTFVGSSETDGQFVFKAGAETDILTGGALADTFDLKLGGADTVNAGGGDDAMDIGTTFNSLDKIDGGTGDDTLQVSQMIGARSVYILNGTMLKNVETLRLMDGGTGFNFQVDDTILTTGKTLTIAADWLTGAGITFNGAAETTGAFSVIGSFFADHLTGGGGNDTFDLRQGGGADTVTGNGGNDHFIVISETSSSTHLNGGTGNDTTEVRLTTLDTTVATNWLTGVETLSFGTFLDEVNIHMLDSNVAAGKTLNIDLTAAGGAYMLFDGSAETNGGFHITADTSTPFSQIKGGGGNDVITDTGIVAAKLTGNGGNDTLSGSGNLSGGAGNDLLTGSNTSTITGGSGNDVFKFTDTTGLNTAELKDFDATADKIDLWFTVTGMNSAMTISDFDDITAGHLGVHHAVLATFGGSKYIVVDANGVAGFQLGDDFAVEVTNGSHLGSLTKADFI